jgi:hypothetical protein
VRADPGQGPSDPEAVLVRRLESVIGQVLSNALYLVLPNDVADFEASEPNRTGGCQAVHLTFEHSKIEFRWAWQLRHLTGSDMYYLEAHDGTRLGDGFLTLGVVSAREREPWATSIGHVLRRADIIGIKRSPQAVRLHFANEVAILALGYSGADPLIIGDSDEILVFRGDGDLPSEWITLQTVQTAAHQ